MAEDQRLVKVELRGPDDEVETLWAFDLGQGRYKLDNTPWYAYGVSVGDVIEAEVEGDGGFPVLRRVLEKSGYRTVRITSGADFTDDFLEQIKALGCSLEGATRRYVAINVPPAVALNVVADFLTARNIRWEHADPTWEELYGPAS
jgi:hypothetical protein